MLCPKRNRNGVSAGTDAERDRERSWSIALHSIKDGNVCTSSLAAPASLLRYTLHPVACTESHRVGFQLANAVSILLHVGLALPRCGMPSVVPQSSRPWVMAFHLRRSKWTTGALEPKVDADLRQTMDWRRAAVSLTTSLSGDNLRKQIVRRASSSRPI